MLVGCIFNADGAFFKIGTHRDTLRQASVYGILACGMTLVIISGGIDLAVGSVLALVAVVFSIMSDSLGLVGWLVDSRLPRWSARHAAAVSGVVAARLRRPALHRHAGHDGVRPRRWRNTCPAE